MIKAYKNIIRIIIETLGLFSIVLGIQFLISHPASAQAPGFLGKRLIIGIEAPMIAGYDLRKSDFQYYTLTDNGNLNEIELDYSDFYFRIKPTVYLEYVLNRKTSLQAFGRFFSAKVDITPFSNYVNFNEVTFYPTDRAKSQTTSFGLKYKVFRKESLSPVGKYMSFGLEYATTKFEFLDDQFTGYTDNNTVVYSVPSVAESSTIIPTIGWGSQRPFGNLFLFSFGMELGIPFSIIDFSDTYNPSSDEWANQNSKNNFWRSYAFNITFGLALIP